MVVSDDHYLLINLLFHLISDSTSSILMVILSSIKIALFPSAIFPGLILATAMLIMWRFPFDSSRKKLSAEVSEILDIIIQLKRILYK